MTTSLTDTRPQLLFVATVVAPPLVAAGQLLLFLAIGFGVLALAAESTVAGGVPCAAALGLVMFLGLGMYVLDRQPVRVCTLFSDRVELGAGTLGIARSRTHALDRVRHLGLREGGVLRLVLLREDGLDLQELNLSVGRLHAEDRFDQLVDALEAIGHDHSVRDRRGRVEWSRPFEWRRAFGPEQMVDAVAYRNGVGQAQPLDHVRVDLPDFHWRLDDLESTATCCLGTENGVYSAAGLLFARVESGGADAVLVRFVDGEAFLVDFQAESIGRQTDDPRVFDRAGRFLFDRGVLAVDMPMPRATLLILASVRGRLLVARDPS